MTTAHPLDANETMVGTGGPIIKNRRIFKKSGRFHAINRMSDMDRRTLFFATHTDGSWTRDIMAADKPVLLFAKRFCLVPPV
jgi:hypothetical protein